MVTKKAVLRPLCCPLGVSGKDHSTATRGRKTGHAAAALEIQGALEDPSLAQCLREVLLLRISRWTRASSYL